MSDQLIKRASVLKEKKLFKKIKIHAFETLKRFLILLMNQKVENIIIKNIFDALFLIHQIIFQNLS